MMLSDLTLKHVQGFNATTSWKFQPSIVAIVGPQYHYSFSSIFKNLFFLVGLVPAFVEWDTLLI